MAQIFENFARLRDISARSLTGGLSMGCSSLIVMIFPVLVLSIVWPLYAAVHQRSEASHILGALLILILYSLVGIALAAIGLLIARAYKLAFDEKSPSNFGQFIIKMARLWRVRVRFNRWKLAQLSEIWLVPNRSYVDAVVSSDVRSELSAEIDRVMKHEKLEGDLPKTYGSRNLRIISYALNVYLFLWIPIFVIVTPMLVRRQ